MNANSVKNRLKNYARETDKTVQDALVLYGLERTLYRLSISEYKEKFTLKGGIYLYALFDGEYVRVTTDIDLEAQHMFHFLEVITWIIGVIILYRKPKEFVVELGLSIVIAFLYQLLDMPHFG